VNGQFGAAHVAAAVHNMTTAAQVTAALRDLADMVEAIGITSITVDIQPDDAHGNVRVHITPQTTGGEDHDPENARWVVGEIARYIGTPLEAGHSNGEMWNVGSPWPGRLLSGASARVHRRIPGRPLDLAPLPARRRRKTSVRRDTDSAPEYSDVPDGGASCP